MIVVAGSSHDSVAQDLVRRWPSAALCSADDLTASGWRWPAPPGVGGAIWVVDGATVPDDEVTGVFLRRSAVYADEFPRTHPDDRSYMAAEVQAFLVFVLATTAAVVVNPVVDGSLGVDALRPERWMATASRVGVAVAPLRLTSTEHAQVPDPTTIIEVVDGEPLGAPPASLAEAAVAVTSAVGLAWVAAAFDADDRLVALSTARRPSSDAAHSLGRFLAGPAA